VIRAVLLVVLLLVAPSLRAQDLIDLHQASVANSPADIADWPITTRIVRVTLSPAEGVGLTFPAQATWPNVIPPGWTGALQYTVWAVAKVHGSWATSGIVQMWQGRQTTGAYETGSFFTDFPKNWAYDGRWGALDGYRPQPGEAFGFFVSAGDARGNLGVSSVRERSNVVLVTLPANDVGDFTFGAPTPIPTPDPPTPAPLPAIDLGPLLQQLAALEARLTALAARIPTCRVTGFGIRFACTVTP
jgi:hypothetical protein